MTPIVSVNGLVKRYHKGGEFVNVLNGLSLEIKEGEFVALMGPSGSGKTTLLNIISGLDQYDEGDVFVCGSRLNEISGRDLDSWRARHIGFVFQFYNLMPTLTAERNVELPLLLTRLSRAQRRRNANAALTLVGIADRAKHLPSELSGGQQQRVAIARALVTDASLLVCDEPTGDLDRESAEEILEIMRSLNVDQGKTIVMVTHDPLAARSASRQIHLDKGRIRS